MGVAEIEYILERTGVLRARLEILVAIGAQALVGADHAERTLMILMAGTAFGVAELGQVEFCRIRVRGSVRMARQAGSVAHGQERVLVALDAVLAEEPVRGIERTRVPAHRAGQRRMPEQFAEAGNEVADHRQGKAEPEDQRKQDPRRHALADAGLGQRRRLRAPLLLGFLLALVERADFDAAVEILRRRQHGQARIADLDDCIRVGNGRVDDLAVDANAGEYQRLDLVLAVRQQGHARVIQRRAQVGQEDRLIGGAADRQDVAVVDVLLIADGAFAFFQDAADQPAHWVSSARMAVPVLPLLFIPAKAGTQCLCFWFLNCRITEIGGELLLLLLRQDAAEMGPLWRGEGVEEKPEGSRAGCARGRCAHMDVRSAPPEPTREPGGQDARKARHLGCVSFGYLSLHKQRKVTRSPAGRVKALHCESRRQRSKWIPASAGMTSKERRWIPAFAGMTSIVRRAAIVVT